MIRPLAFADRLERRLRLADWPLYAKFGLTPALILLSMIALSTVAATALIWSANSADHIVTSDMRTVARLGDTSTAFQRADGDLYRLIVTKAADRHTDVTAGADRIRHGLADVRARLGVLRQTVDDPVDRARVNQMIHLVDTYADATNVLTSMLDIDFASSVAMLNPFRANADRVVRELDEIRRHGVASANRRAAESAWRIHAFVVLIAVMAVSVLAVGIALTTIVGYATISSIKRIADATQRLDDVDAIDLGALSRKDELGRVVDALILFRTRSSEAARLRADREALRERALEAEERRLEELRQLEASNREMRRETLERLAREFESSIATLIGHVGGAASDIEQNARRLETSAQENQRHSVDLDNIAELFSHEMTDAGSATTALADAIRTIDQQVSETSEVALSMAERAGLTRQSVSETNENADRIERVVTVIDDIARQTSLLALNATIEAARSGEAGRGFSVVAAEIKALSLRSSASTADVRQQIADVQNGVRRAVSATDELHGLIERMNSVTDHVAAATRNQARSTETIEHRVDIVLDRARAVAKASADIRVAAQTNQNAVQELQSMAIGLRRMIDELQTYSGLFKNSLLAA